MQKIAAEFNYSEVTFVLPPEDPRNTARVRIFTPTMEVPFAGHPNVGTAYVLGQQAEVFGRAVGDTLRFEEKAGLVEVNLKRDGGRVVGAAITCAEAADASAHDRRRQPSPAASRSTPSRIRTRRMRRCFASVGLTFVVAEVDGICRRWPLPDQTLPYFQDAAGPTTTAAMTVSLFVYVRTPEVLEHSRPHVRAARQRHRRPGNRQCLRCARRLPRLACCRRPT